VGGSVVGGSVVGGSGTGATGLGAPTRTETPQPLLNRTSIRSSTPATARSALKARPSSGSAEQGGQPMRVLPARAAGGGAGRSPAGAADGATGAAGPCAGRPPARAAGPCAASTVSAMAATAPADAGQLTTGR
jgi:hypothetical protein